MTERMRTRPLRAAVVALGALGAIVFGAACNDSQPGDDGGDQQQDQQQDQDRDQDQDQDQDGEQERDQGGYGG